jgi:hypothetical protein
MTTVLFGLIGTALIVAIPIACLFLARPKAPEHDGRIGELLTIDGIDFCITHMTFDSRGTTIELMDRKTFESMFRVPA